MSGTVDVVIADDASASRAAAVVALQRIQRVLVVLRSADTRVARRLRRRLLKAAGAGGGRLVVITGAEVVCVDGLDDVEAVVIRHARTGRLSAVNASAFVSSDSPSRRYLRPGCARLESSGAESRTPHSYRAAGTRAEK